MLRFKSFWPTYACTIPTILHYLTLFYTILHYLTLSYTILHYFTLSYTNNGMGYTTTALLTIEIFLKPSFENILRTCCELLHIFTEELLI
jgi:hypothetical protein